VVRDGAFSLRQRFRIADLARAGTRRDPLLRLPTLLLEAPAATPGRAPGPRDR
jgi:hypothetical protein